MMNNIKGYFTTKKVVLIFLFSILIFLSIVFISLLIVLLMKENRKPENNFNQCMSEYVEITPSLNHTNAGIAHLGRKFLENEYLSYTNKETENLVLITSLGGTKYECTGSCFCEDSERRNFQNIILTRGLFIVLSSLTVLSALQMSKDIFHSSCVNNFEDICETSKIKSVVDDCVLEEEEYVIHEDQIHEFLEYAAGGNKENTNENEKDVKHYEVRSYTCGGHCIERNDMSKYLYNLKSGGGSINIQVSSSTKFGESKNCEKLELNGVRIVIPNDMIPPNFRVGELRYIDNFAKWNFMIDHLEPFCQSNSFFSYYEENDITKNEYDYACVGNSYFNQGKNVFGEEDMIKLTRKSNFGKENVICTYNGIQGVKRE